MLGIFFRGEEALVSFQHKCVYLKACCLTPLLVVLSFSAAVSEPVSQSAILKSFLNKPFSISVSSNPSTGYAWVASFDSQFLKLKGKTFCRDRSKPERMVGVGGTTTFVFVPIRAGETSVTLRYRRSWESGTAKKRTYRIVISAEACRSPR
jgi:predicted secreted protein